uniref:Fork-head domain-containing protein n=1 Tax=Panagrellus redivivus TaxID=6233 RepID=A0A7E4UUR4_PANRE
MSRENQTRKSVSLIDLRCGDSQVFMDSSVASTDDRNVFNDDRPTTMFRADSATSFDPVPVSNNMVACRQPSNGWFSEDDSGFESASVVSTIEPSMALRNLFNVHRSKRPRIATYFSLDRDRVNKLVRGKVQKRAPVFSLGSSIRRKSIHELRLPPVISNSSRAGVGRNTRILRRGNCIYVGKAATVAMEDCDDMMSVPSSASSTSDSPSYFLTSPPRCNIAFSSTMRRRHSLYAKVYGHRISAVVEENPRSIVEGLDLDGSASYAETNSHAPLMPSSSLSVDFFAPEMENTLNRFNSLCIAMQSDDGTFSSNLMPTDDLCNQFSMMTTQPHSTGHSPFASPSPADTWMMPTGPSASAQDLLTPNASEMRTSALFFPASSTPSSMTTPTDE